jgi:hypothetical protein
MTQLIKGWSDKRIAGFNVLFDQVKEDSEKNHEFKRTGWKQETRHEWRMTPNPQSANTNHYEHAWSYSNCRTKGQHCANCK